MKICIIDDCRDADVPLLELTLVDLTLRQEYSGPGDASAALSIDYYNRVLSGWEPFVEQWRASMQWEQTLSSSSLSSKRLRIRVDSQNSVNVNITSTLVELITLVKENWTQDYDLLNNQNISKLSAYIFIKVHFQVIMKLVFQVTTKIIGEDLLLSHLL